MRLVRFRPALWPFPVALTMVVTAPALETHKATLSYLDRLSRKYLTWTYARKGQLRHCYLVFLTKLDRRCLAMFCTWRAAYSAPAFQVLSIAKDLLSYDYCYRLGLDSHYHHRRRRHCR